MYKLIDGRTVEFLEFHTGVNGWEVSQWYYYNGEIVQQAYNTETGEIKIYNAKGEDVEIIIS